MKQKLLNKFWLRVGMIVAVMTTALAGTAWADYEPVITLDCATASLNGTTELYGSKTGTLSVSQLKSFLNAAAGEEAVSSVASTPTTIYWTKGTGGTGIPDDVLKIGKASGGGNFTFTISDSYDEINKVSIKGYGWKTTTAVSVNSSSTQSPSSAATEVTFEYVLGTATRTIAITVSSSAFCATEIVLYKEISGTSTPSISADDVNVAYNAASGSISYTINNVPTPAGTLTAATTSDWLTLGTVGTTVPFTCSANNTTAARTATVTLTYTYGSNQTVTKAVTVTQAGNPNIVDNISDITAAGTYTVQGTIVAKSTRGFIVGDGTGYVYYYNTSYSQTDYNIGDKVKLSGAVSAYGGVLEYSSSATVTSATESNYVEEEPTVLSGSDMDTRVASTTPAQLSSYVQYEGTLSVSGTYYNITNISGASTAQGSISFPISTDFTSLSGKTVKVTGYYVGISSSKYYNTLIGTIEEVTNAAPVIDASNVTLEHDATSGEIAYTIANPVSGVTLSATTNADWISNITVGASSVTFTTTANEGNADRTATITLSYTGAENKVVTVTQGHYVADFATLPFEFDGGRADIANTAGLTHEGLGSDYSSSPKLKFDGTDDYLVLHFNERPGTLTFDIKGNPGSDGWAGTFKVQTSEDGTTFTDLATYTELTSTVQSELFSNLGENVRYIKWIYTEKVSGNVALGNISLLQYGAVETYTVSWTEGEHTELFVFAGEESESIENGAAVAVGTTVMVSVSADEGYELSPLTVKDADDNDIELTTIEEGSYYSFEMPTSNVTITSSATQSSVTPVTGDKYVKVTSADDLTDGQYLIVYEDGGLAFDGSLETLDAVGNTINVTISDGEIAANTTTIAAEFTIEETDDGYCIKSASGKYIGRTSNTNGLESSDETVYTNAITFSDNNADIVSGGAYMRYNSNSGQERFRYFKSSTYTNQKAIQLYKFVEATPEPYAPETITLNASGYATFASTSAVDFTNAETNGYSAWAVTAVSGSEITFSQITGAVAAGTGVLLKGTANTQVTIAYTTSGATLSDNKLVGFTAATEINSNEYFGLSGAKFVKVNGGTVPAGKALLPATAVNGEVKAFTFNFDEDATAIKAIDNGQLTTDGVIYNVAGQRLGKMQKGINIVNGKKILK